MEQTTYLVHFLTDTMRSYIWEYRIPALMMLGVIGFVAYMIGDSIRKHGLTMAAQNQATDFPYRSVALSLKIPGVVLMILSAIMLYFAGGYAALFAKLGW